MRKESIFLLVLSFLFVACSSPRNTSAVIIPTPIPLSKEESHYVDIQTNTINLKVGETVTITGTIVGDFGNPLYSMKLKDHGVSQSVLLISLTPSNEITHKTDASNVLKLVSANVVSNQVTMVLEGHSSGITEVSISVNGEIGEADGSGRWQLNYVTKFSEGLAITVTN